MKNLSRAILFFSILASTWLLNSALAANPLDVVINEIAWMGQGSSANDEWLELYNNTEQTIDLTGWTLKADDGTPEINLSGTIPAHSFYLLERTDNNTLPDIPANLIYSGALNNQGESLRLSDQVLNLIDRVDSQTGWLAGSNATKQTMERINASFLGSHPDSWQTSQNPGGTPKAQNSLMMVKEIVKPAITEVMVYPSGVVINEILPSPLGSDIEKEWIELSNQSDVEVDLSGWKILDVYGEKSTIFTFPQGDKIKPKGFLVLPRTTTKITLNDQADSLKLLWPNQVVVEIINYEKAQEGQSYNRTVSGWAWSTLITPGAENIIATSKTNTPKEKEVGAENPIKIELTREGLASLGEVGEVTQKPLSSPLFFLVPSFLALFCGLIILILKKKTKLS